MFRILKTEYFAIKSAKLSFRFYIERFVYEWEIKKDYILSYNQLKATADSEQK